MLGHRRVHLLKMDIEGAEFAVLESILALPGAADIRLPATGSELPFDQLLVEFHPDLHPAGRAAGGAAVERNAAALMRLGFRLVNRTRSLELS